MIIEESLLYFILPTAVIALGVGFGWLGFSYWRRK